MHSISYFRTFPRLENFGPSCIHSLGYHTCEHGCFGVSVFQTSSILRGVFELIKCVQKSYRNTRCGVFGNLGLNFYYQFVPKYRIVASMGEGPSQNVKKYCVVWCVRLCVFILPWVFSVAEFIFGVILLPRVKLWLRGIGDQIKKMSTIL